MKTIHILLLTLVATGLAFADSPAWDTSGDGQLTGTYNFRQVLYNSDGAGYINYQVAYFGTILFDGKGGYTLSGNNTLLNTGNTLPIPSAGTYSVAGSGYGFLSNPLVPGASLYFLVAKGILVGSSTELPGSNESYNNDLFIAAPATPSFTNANFKGAYTVAGFLPGIDVSYPLNPDGAGQLGRVNKSGYNATGTFSQSSANGTYTFTGGVGSTSIGTDLIANGATQSYGQETLYLSPDTNFVFGGSPTGYDFFVGVRNATGATLTDTLYYEIGIDEDESQWVSGQTANIDTYYGVFNAFSGTVIGHERLLYASPFTGGTEGVTYTTSYPAGSYSGSANVGQLDPSATVQYTVGTGGMRIGFGIGPWLGIEVALPATPPLPSGSVYVDPTGIVSTASSAPFTAGISPGEFISLYNGVNLAPSSQCWTAGPPFPKALGGVTVLINGVEAPIYCVGSPTTVIVPYAAGNSPVATIQVVNNNVPSNVVTSFVYPTTPGVFSFNPVGGIGYAAAEHGNYSVVTPDNPAKPGETIAVYLTGLGNVFCVKNPPPSTACVPAADGGITNPQGDTIVATIAVDVAGFGSTSIPYAGLSPEAGLYQINFQVPDTAPTGNDALAIVGQGSYSSESVLPVLAPGSSGTAQVARPARRVLPRLNAPRPNGGTKGTIRR